MPFWRAYLQCRFTSLSRSGNREGLGKFHPAIALDPPDDVVGRGIEVGPPAMTVEFEFLAMRGHRRHDGFRGSLSVFEGRGGQNAAHDHAGVHVPRLRLKVELDGDAVLARLVEQVVEFAESLDGKWAGRFQKHLEDARPVAPDQRISAPCFHAIFPLPGSVPGESPKRSNASGLLKLPRL